MGRVLSNRPGGGPRDHDSVWANIVNTYRRWESDEVSGAAVSLCFGGQTIETVTDEEGYYRGEFRFSGSDEQTLEWVQVLARTAGKIGDIYATHDVLVPGSGAQFGVISDLDDTVIETGVTNLLLAAKLTFLANAKTRKPLEGVAELYRALRHGTAGAPVNPIFYVSSSPWNLYELLAEFMELNEIPAGPLLLQDLGIDAATFISPHGHEHKLDHALRIMAAYPRLPFILVGDSGQQDAHLYAEAARQHGSRIKAIYIRDVDPVTATARDEDVGRMIARAREHGVPMLLAPNSGMISHHAAELGLIPGERLPAIEAGVERDEQRLSTGAQAAADAAS